MDVAEQALTALAMLSRRHGKAILQAVSIHCSSNTMGQNYCMNALLACIIRIFVGILGI